MTATHCPPDDRLRAFDRGDVSDAALDEIAAHLGRCEACVRRMATIAARVPPILSESAAEPDDSAYRRAVAQAAGTLPPVATSRQPAVGDTLRDYLLTEKIGHGGMGAVFKAVHTKLDKTVAVKVLSGKRWHEPAAVARFEREMRAVGRLSHPNIVQATDADDSDGVPFLVMEYVEGENLSAFVRRCGPRPLEEAGELVAQAAAGLTHAHAAGIVHRDVKPSNLIRRPDGTVKVLDLGLALLGVPEVTAGGETRAGGSTDASAHGSDLTSASHTVGTIDYMPPEQKRDAHAVDERVDVYGLGCTLWFLLTGKPPRPGEVPSAGGLPVAFWKKFLAADPDQRFPTVEAAAAEMSRQIAPRSRRARRTRRIAVGLTLLITTVVTAFVLTRPAPPAPPNTDPPEIGQLPLTDEQAADLQERWACHAALFRAEEAANGTTLALVPPGEFMLSSQCRVRLTRAFQVGTCEVTVAQFRRFVKATGYVPSAIASGKGGIDLTRFRPQAGNTEALSDPTLSWENPGHPSLDPDQPVSVVSWDDARAYCRWLGTQDGKTYRLPTAAEFAWAARCGDPSDDVVHLKRVTEIGWFRLNCKQPMPVGMRKANAWGLFDLHGNVAEWCSDRFAQLPVGTFDDYPGPADPEHPERVFLGWSYLAPAFKPSPLRDKAPPDYSFAHVGFRVACDVR